jgi:hypothetical protein
MSKVVLDLEWRMSACASRTWTPTLFSQASPVDPLYAQFSSRRLDVPAEDAVITHRGARPDGLKYKIVRPIRLHHLEVPSRPPSPDIQE